MRPVVSLIQPARISNYLPPDNLPSTELVDWQLGGIGLSDASQGLQYQSWQLQVLGTGAGTYISLSAPNTSPTTIFSYANIEWARLAFDQNMHPVISFVAASLPYFWWWDPLIPGNTVTALPTTIIKPCVTMDDKRDLQTTQGNNDVVMAYINGANLCYRLQRDRYGVEYIWMSNITNIIANPFVNKIGMTNSLRLQLDIRGAIYL